MDRTEAWEEIERSESFLVCSMYDEAASLASSILKKILDNSNVISKEPVDDNQLHDIFESAGMVLVQSLYGVGRTSEILNGLQCLFGTAAAIPVEVLLTGVCFQISNGSYSGVREILEEFLSKWVYDDEGKYIIIDAEANASFLKGCVGDRCLDVDAYMEVVELYTLKFLGTILKDVDLAISWVEKGALPEERRQGLLRRLHSLFSHKATNALQGSSLLLPENKPKGSFVKDPTASEGSPDALSNNYHGENDANHAVLKLSRQQNSSFWSSHPLNLKFGKVQLIMSNGKIVLSLLIFILCYALRRKRAALMRTLKAQTLSVKKALVDLWQLAFSYQVNPLAAVQPIPGTTRGG